MMRLALALPLALLAAAPARAQEPAPAAQPGEELWDGVVAVVGDTVLLRSDVLLAVEQARAAGQPVPSDPAQYGEFVEALVEQQVADLLLLEAARNDGTVVSDSEVQLAVDEQVQRVRSSFPSEAAFDQALSESGRTLETYRAELMEQFRAETLVQRYMRGRMAKLPPLPVTDAEVEAFFNANRERFGTRPAAVSFQQVLVRPRPADSARAAALRTVEEVMRELASGTEFETVARRYSQDGTRERGGDLGWFRQGQMVREFNDVVFAMRPGQVSGVVETEFGFHIIKLERVRGPERQARHILIRPEITPADIERARQRADSVAQAVREGASVPDLAARYRTPDQARFQREVPIDQLAPAYVNALQGASEGSVVGPLTVEGGPTPVFAVVRLTSRQTQGQYTVDDQRDRIRQLLQEQKMARALVEELRRDMYVSIRL